MNLPFSPHLRYIAKSSYYIRHKYVIAPDCRFFYFISGSGTYQTKKYVYNLAPGTLLYFPYGTPYKIRSSKENPLYFYTVNFDFNKNHCDISTMVPQPESLHDPQKEIRSISDDLKVPFENIIYIKDAAHIESSIRKMHDEAINDEPGSKFLIEAYLKIILTYIYRYTVKTTDNSLCKKLKFIISQHPELNNNDISRILNYNSVYLNTVFKENEGITLHKFILRTRLTKAHELITETSLSLSTIAATCGFSSQAHLSTAFKKEYNISPGLIRKQT